MARLNTLSELLEMLRAECRVTTSVAQGQANENHFKQLIRRYYEQLYDEYDWPFLRIPKASARKTLAAGSRYYDFPAEINLERIDRIWFKDGSTWIPLKRGIQPSDYAIHDSDNDSRADPPIKWDIYSATQFEIWPMPASSGEVWVDGTKKFSPLTANSDLCELDGLMIVLFCAAEVLAATKQADAELKRAAAQTRLDQLKAKVSNSDEDFVLGGDDMPEQCRYPKIMVTATTT